MRKEIAQKSVAPARPAGFHELRAAHPSQVRFRHSFERIVPVLALSLLCTANAAGAAPQRFSPPQRIPIVQIPPGTTVTPADITLFNNRWMIPIEKKPCSENVWAYPNCRIAEYRAALELRAHYIVWQISDDAMAMVQMFELTHDTQYLDHLQRIAEVTWAYRDDRHPGITGSLVCFKCNREAGDFIDHERGGVQAAWSDGGHLDYVLNAGLTPVDAVGSGILAYPIAAFARLVAEDPSLSTNPDGSLTSRGVAALRLANAAVEVFHVFAPEHRYDVGPGGFVQGSIYSPRILGTNGIASEADWDARCGQAYADASDHLLRVVLPVSTESFLAIQAQLPGYFTRCRVSTLEVSDHPFPYNVTGSLLMAFIELWRALDSDFYRASPASTASAAVARALIPFVAARQQRYFVNNLFAISSPEGINYRWRYSFEGAPHPGWEDTSHADFDMSFIGVLLGSVARLDAVTAPAGEPIPLDHAILRRFANTFVHKIALPAEIDNVGSLRCDVDGVPASDCPDEYFDPVTDGWASLAVVDPTVYRMVHAVSLRRVDDGKPETPSQLNLTIGNHAALLATKRYSRDVRAADLTAAAGSPPAAGEPFAWVHAAQDVQNVTYRGTDGHVYELWRTASGTGYSNLSALAGAPRAAGDPKAWEWPPAGTHNVVYRGTDNHLHALWWTDGPVGHDDLTALSGAPSAAGDPFPYVSPPFGVQNVAYRGTDGHLHVLYWSFGAVGHDDLTALSGAPAPRRDPFAYFIDAFGVQNVLYVGIDDHIHGLYWSTGAVAHDDLTALSGAPVPAGSVDTRPMGSAGDPVATVTPAGLQHAIYLGLDGHLHVLYWDLGAVGHDDLSVLVSGAPLPSGRPEAYYNPLDGTQHVIYRAPNGQLHELGWSSGGVSHANLNTLAPASVPSASKASGYVFPPDRSQHAIYRDADGHLRDLSWVTASAIIRIKSPGPMP